MKSVIKWAINNSPAMNTLMIATMLVGAVSLMKMRREVFPEFELDIVLVSVPYPGARPEEVEEGICQKIEEATQSIDGIKKATAIAQEGEGFLVLELNASADSQRVLAEVRSEIDQIPSFPENAEDHEVKMITFRFPAIRVGVIGPDHEPGDVEAELALREITEQVREDILQLERPAPSNPIEKLAATIFGHQKSVVSSVNIMGSRDYQIDVEIAEEDLRAYGLSLEQVAQIIRSQNTELPAGKIKTPGQEILLVGGEKFVNGRQIEELEIRSQTTGDVVTLKELGTVRDGFVDETMISRVDGLPALVIGVDRTSEEDLLALVEDVRDYVNTKQLPRGYRIQVWYDQSIDVRDRMMMLVKNGLTGLLLVFIVLAIFLEMRLAFWVALGIPIAVLGAGGVLLAGGQTLNMLSMFAFLMALGIVVNDAIVIGENIYHHRQLDKGFVRAAIDGTFEVLPSVIASVSTTIIAFMPLMFVTGMMGKFIAVLPVAVVAMLIISLFESTFILPCHLSHHDNLFFRIIGVIFYPFKFVLDAFRWLNQGSTRIMKSFIERAYLPALRWCLHNPATVVSGALALMILAVGFVAAGVTPFVIFPELDNRFIEASIAYPDGTSAEQTDEATKRLEEAIIRINNKYSDQGVPFMVVRHRMVGQTSALGNTLPGQTSSGSHVGNVSVELVASGERPGLSSEQLMKEWREEAGDFPGADQVTFAAPAIGPGGTPIEFKLLAREEDMDKLNEAVEKCKEKLRSYEGVFDVKDDSQPGKTELRFAIRDEAHALGVTKGDLARTVRGSFYGEEVMRLQRGRHEVKLMVRYPKEDRTSMTNFEEIRVRADDTELPITELADESYERKTSEVNRINQLRSITVSADIDEAAGANAREIVADMQKTFMPGLLGEYESVRVRWEGQQEQTQESVASLFAGFLIALLCMFVLLTIAFRSYLQPLIILAIIPFGFIGAVAGHAVFDLNLTLFSLFGLVALTGVVVNDSIVLIDFINKRIRDGMPLNDALLEAGKRRFRPVFLTSLTTIAGLLPILLETSFQAQILIPMATSLCFGLMLATGLILLLVPTFYYIYARLCLSLPLVTVPATEETPIQDVDLDEEVLEDEGVLQT